MMYDFDDFARHRAGDEHTQSAHSHRYNLRKRKLRPAEDDDLFALKPASTTGVEVKDHVKLDKDGKDSFTMMTLFALSMFTRFLFVNSSPIVVWDEAHFGKFANFYIKRTFYFDVHPPLGKMLIAFSGWFFNYDGSFSFDSGKKYDETVPIAYMRAFCAFFGSLIVPLVYGTCRNMKYSRRISLLVASCLLFDNAVLTISKFVLLDPILLCFTAMSFHSITRFERCHKHPFSRQWYQWLIMTGVSLGLVLSVKWVGLFTYAFVGTFTIRQLWNLLPSARREPQVYFRHFISRAILLIALPMAIYMSTFYAHFAVLNRSGPGDAQMSSRFQASLIGSKIREGPTFAIINASLITLRNRGHGGGILHSHTQSYPVGSKQGQVTLYHHQDNNNYFKILPPWGEEPEVEVLPSGTIKVLTGFRRDGILEDRDTIRLSHNGTGRNLHSHNVPAPITVFQNEVSGYGNGTIGDEKDHWIVEVVHSASDGRIVRLETSFRLRHAVLGCYLASSGARLPDWGFSQMEVICTNMPSKNAEWNIEENVVATSLHYVAPEPRKQYMTTKLRHFFSDFVDLNVAMWNGNNALVPKLGKKDMLISTPSQWPFLQVGLRMCNWNEDTIKYYLLGNPIVWWLGSFSVVWWIVDILHVHIKEKMFGFVSQDEVENVNGGMMWAIGWLLHYYPFQMMGRVTYLHHYFPALMASVVLFGHQMRRFSRTWMVPTLTVIIFSAFCFFSPLTYGFAGKANELMGARQWRGTWNMVDVD